MCDTPHTRMLRQRIFFQLVTTMQELKLASLGFQYFTLHDVHAPAVCGNPDVALRIFVDIINIVIAERVRIMAVMRIVNNGLTVL